MSKIVIIVDQTDVPANIMVALQKLTFTALSIIRQAIQSHAPLADYKLFYNDHDEVTSKLKAITDLLNRNAITYSLYELDEDATPANNENLNIDKIDYDTLVNILDSHGKN